MDNEYWGFFAEFYDIIHSHSNETEAYIKFASTYGSNILELGSGTGRLLVPLAKAGCHVSGLELNDDMIEICKNKITNENIVNNADIIKGNMTAFKLNKRFNMIIAPCNLINHLLKT